MYKFDSSSIFNNIPFSLKLNSSIDISKLKKVVSQWINKNSILHFNYNNDNKFYQQKNSQISDYNTIEEYIKNHSN